MGMTNEQFDSYKKMLLRRLERAAEESKDNEQLKQIIEDLREELRKP